MLNILIIKYLKYNTGFIKEFTLFVNNDNKRSSLNVE